MEYFFNVDTECPKCCNEGSYFNGLEYECPECGFTWNDDECFTENSLDESEALEKYFEQQDMIKVGTILNLNSIRNLFSPSYQFEKGLMLYAKEGIVDEFTLEIYRVLDKTKKFSEILKIQPKKDINKEETQQIIESKVFSYLESRDELPLFPSTKDWAKYIDAPENLIEKIILKHHSNIISYLPHTDEGGLTVLFVRKIENLYNTLKAKNEITEYGHLTLDEMKEVFTNLADGENSMYMCMKNPSISFIESEIAKFFSTELKAIKRYRHDIKKWKDGTLDNYIIEAKKQKLSKIDTIVFVLEDYFKDILICG